MKSQETDRLFSRLEKGERELGKKNEKGWAIGTSLYTQVGHFHSIY